MRRASVTFWSLCVGLSAVLATGCSRQTERPSLKSLIKKVRPTPPKELVAMMFDVNDADRRREGIEGLSKHSWGRKEPYLKAYATALKTDRDPLVRSAAVRALGRAGDRKYIVPVVEALKDEETVVRWDAAVALDNLSGEVAIDPLRKAAVSDGSADVRLAAVQALRHYQRPRVKTTLVRCLSDSQFPVRHRAHQVLVKLVGKDHGFEPDGWIAGGIKPPRRDEPEESGKKPWWRIFSWRRRGEGKTAPEPQAGDRPPEPPGPALKPTRRKPPWWKSVGRSRPQPKTSPGPAPPWWDWLDLTSRREKPAKEPAPKASRPWWDWAGITSRKGKPAEPAANPTPKERSKPRRPWWDWFGITRRKPAEPRAPEPAERRPGPRPPAKRRPAPSSKRPTTWDGLRWVPPKEAKATERKSPPPAKRGAPRTPAPAKAPAWPDPSAAKKGEKRPWWDWFGLTKKKAKPRDR